MIKCGCRVDAEPAAKKREAEAAATEHKSAFFKITTF
jgi:hypothetical protein